MFAKSLLRESWTSSHSPGGERGEGILTWKALASPINSPPLGQVDILGLAIINLIILLQSPEGVLYHYWWSYYSEYSLKEYPGEYCSSRASYGECVLHQRVYSLNPQLLVVGSISPKSTLPESTCNGSARHRSTSYKYLHKLRQGVLLKHERSTRSWQGHQ